MVIYFLNFNHSFLKLNVCRYEQILYIKKNVHFLFKSMLCILVCTFTVKSAAYKSILKLTLKRTVNINALGVPSHTLAVFLFNSPRANPTLFKKKVRVNVPILQRISSKKFLPFGLLIIFLCKVTFPQLITSIEEQT